ncbi:hypothetical protein BVY01_00510, partial [bacterium I07]
ICILLLAVLPLQTISAEKFIISDPEDVADVALRGGDFGNWNYGRGLFLETGYFIGLYDTPPAASLIRFNLTGLRARTVQSAKFRIYKLKSMSQKGSVDVHVYSVSEANGNWVEGGSESKREEGASTWQFKGNGIPWAGTSGASKADVDFETPVLATPQTVNPETSGWLEFDLPTALVQSWLDKPSTNNGLYLTSQANPDLSDEAHFYSSEHFSGKGPELIITATAGVPKTPRQEWPANPPYYFPPVDAPGYLDWKANATGRYSRWANKAPGTLGKILNFSNEQGLWCYYWDIIDRMNTTYKCFLPLANNIVDLNNLVPDSPDYTPPPDQVKVNAILDELRFTLLKYEDVKSMHIHQAGPVAEWLSPYQLAAMLAWEGLGVHCRHGAARYKFQSESDIEKRVRKEIKAVSEDFNFTPEQYEICESYLLDYETKRAEYSNATGKAILSAQSRMNRNENGPELFKDARDVFWNHKLMVYWLSDFNTPKWNLWREIVQIEPVRLANEFWNARNDNYVLEKIKNVTIPEARKYWWYPPVLYVDPNKPGLIRDVFGTRDWPFMDINDAINAAENGTEIRVAGSIE